MEPITWFLGYQKRKWWQFFAVIGQCIANSSSYIIIDQLQHLIHLCDNRLIYLNKQNFCDFSANHRTSGTLNRKCDFFCLLYMVVRERSESAILAILPCQESTCLDLSYYHSNWRLMTYVSHFSIIMPETAQKKYTTKFDNKTTKIKLDRSYFWG